MSRYIDVDKLIQKIFPMGMLADGNYPINAKAIRVAIDSIPTADVVEVVRCKDCKHWLNEGYDPIINRHFGSCTCEYWEHPTEYFETAENDYCSYGERK